MTRIALLTGGSTPERTVALAGAGQVVSALRGGGHEVVVVDTCSGVLEASEEADLLQGAVGAQPPTETELCHLRQREDLLRWVSCDAVRACDVVFPVLHGREGEGGLLQTLLFQQGLLHTGTDTRGSVLAMDKDVAKRLVCQAGLATPSWRLFTSSNGCRTDDLSFPLVVKPSRVGSTVGLSLVRSAQQLDAAIGEALRFDDEVLLEQFLPGAELTVGVLGDKALGVGEIRTGGEIFDFHSKYTPGRATELFPAPIAPQLTQRLQDDAMQIHELLRLRDYSRVDFRLDEQGEPFFLEANTLPGMTETSLLPQSAAVSGLSFSDLCCRIVELAEERSLHS